MEKMMREKREPLKFISGASIFLGVHVTIFLAAYFGEYMLGISPQFALPLAYAFLFLGVIIIPIMFFYSASWRRRFPQAVRRIIFLHTQLSESSVSELKISDSNQTSKTGANR